MTPKILLSSNPTSLASALAEYTRTGTVEAEYGETVVPGSIVTLAHHGSRSNNPSPCLHPNEDMKLDAIGVSHFDLDTLGGILSLLGERRVNGFWDLVTHVDFHGPHTICTWDTGCLHHQTDLFELQLYTFWAWAAKNRCPMAPRDGSILDISEYVLQAAQALDAIFLQEDYFEGRAWKKELEELEASSYQGQYEKTLIRVSDKFTNALYEHLGVIYSSVLAYNTTTKAITLSFAQAGTGNACEIMQQVFGPLAGGHAGIAGTPRGEVFTAYDMEQVIDYLKEALKKLKASSFQDCFSSIEDSAETSE